MDVHPLAVTIARINYLLAIIPHMRGARSSGTTGLSPLPVYMADALLLPEAQGSHKDTLVVPVDHERDEKFHIPVNAAQAPAVFNDVVDQMDAFARRPKEEINLSLRSTFHNIVKTRFPQAERGLDTDLSVSYWGSNLTLLNKLIYEKRNSIWAYILKNSARPLLLSAQKFDVIAGNPPWLSYRYLSKAYQKEVKALTLHYGLLEAVMNYKTKAINCENLASIKTAKAKKCSPLSVSGKRS
jgi:hypothetical protein